MPEKPVPVTVIFVPPPLGPFFGRTPVTVGPVSLGGTHSIAFSRRTALVPFAVLTCARTL